jgi:hypothetical protein
VNLEKQIIESQSIFAQHKTVRHIFDELERKDTPESDKSASYLYILLNIDSNDRLTTTLYMTNVMILILQSSTFLCSNIPLPPAYHIKISQLIRFAKGCFAYEDFSKRGKLLANKLML